jgi:hypothetical protein
LKFQNQWGLFPVAINLREVITPRAACPGGDELAGEILLGVVAVHGGGLSESGHIAGIVIQASQY